MAALLLALLALAACGGRARPRTPDQVDRGWQERGIASWYGPGFHGRLTANGEVYDQEGPTAAHKTLPFNTLVEVHNLDNGRSVRVRINDRGPFVRGRIIDLSRRAAREIGMLGPGTARVRIRVVGLAEPAPRTAARAPGGWFVQTGAFRDPDRARAQAAELRREFPSARVRSSDGWHRVRLGPFERRGRAEEVARRLAARGFSPVLTGAD